MEALYSSPVRIMSAPVSSSRWPGWPGARWHYRVSAHKEKIGLSGALLSGSQSMAARGAHAAFRRNDARLRTNAYRPHAGSEAGTGMFDRTSVHVGWIFGVKNPLHLLEMSDREVGDPLPILRGVFGDLVGQNLERLAGCVGLRQDLTAALKRIDVIEGFADRVGGDEHAVIAHHQPRLVAEQPGQAGALLLAVSHSGVAFVDGEPVEVARRILIDR